MARPGIRTKNTEKIPPGPKFWTPRIYPQNTPKIPKKYPQNTKNAHFWYFFGIFGVFSWGSRISARGVFCRYFSWKFRVGPSRGSVAGRGVLNISVERIFRERVSAKNEVLRSMSVAKVWCQYRISALALLFD